MVMLKQNCNDVGAAVGAKVGERVGEIVGAIVGEAVGEKVGALVGAEVGANVGALEGANVGLLVGASVGGTQEQSKARTTRIGSRTPSCFTSMTKSPTARLPATTEVANCAIMMELPKLGGFGLCSAMLGNKAGGGGIVEFGG